MSVDTAHAQEVRARTESRGASEVDSARTAGPVWVGVSRSPPGWFSRRVDVTLAALGLPKAVREELEQRRRDFQMQGLCAEGAHNAAWEEADVDERYRAHLSGEAARNALDELRALAEHDQIVLATDRRPGFRCHRTVLASVLEETEAVSGSD